MDFVHKAVEEIHVLDWGLSMSAVWSKIFALLQLLQSEHCQNNEILDNLSRSMLRLMEETNLVQLWKEIVQRSGVEGNRDCFEVLHGYRIIANIYKGNVAPALTMQEYCRAMMKALAISVLTTPDPNRSASFAAIFSTLSNSSLKYLLEELAQQRSVNNNFGDIIRAANPLWCLNVANIAMKALDGCAMEDVAGYERVFNILMQFVTESGVPISEVLESLVFNKTVPASRNAATVIVSTFAVNELAEVLDTVGFVWGDKHFVSRADVKKQAFFTRILQAALGRCERRHLQVTGSRNLPVEMVLTMGVSNYLEVENISIRQYGMKVAVAYSKLLGEPLHFAELDTIERAEELVTATAALRVIHKKAPATAASPRTGNNSKVTEESGITGTTNGTGTGRREVTQPQSVGYDSDSTDSSAELEGYALDEGGEQGEVYNYKDRMLRTNYLRDCLQMLRCPESKPEARQQLQAALERIPIIMASDPPDALDLCMPLMKELLTVSNNFNLPGFDVLRATAVQAVLQCNPATAVPFLTTSLQGNDLPLGLKFLVLEWLMASAKELTNIPSTDTTSPTAAYSAAASSSLMPDVRLGNTTIKRPTKLALSKQRTKYFRNDFGPLAHLYFYPLMALLGKIWNNKLHEPSLTNSADKFNLISEMFEVKAPAATENTGGQEKRKVVGDASLRHLDGVDALLPSQCLVALGVFTQCSLNTVNQKDHALQVITVASAYRNATAVGIRRAALYALRLAFEAYLPSAASAGSQGRVAAQRGPLDALLHLSDEDALRGTQPVDGATGAGVSSEAAAVSILSQPAVVECVDWAAASWKDDPDEVSRTLKHDIVSMAVKGLS